MEQSQLHFLGLTWLDDSDDNLKKTSKAQAVPLRSIGHPPKTTARSQPYRITRWEGGAM